jgi:anti-sigma factor ChrR (cupin superfamily)
MHLSGYTDEENVSDHLSLDKLEGYRRRRLEPDELLELDDHVATCTACRKALRELLAEGGLWKLRASLEAEATPTSDHLSRSCLAAYEAGGLNAVERELAASHLEFCPECAARLKN